MSIYYNYSINCTDVFGHQSTTGTRRFTLILMGNFTGSTTDLTRVNISNIENLTFENINHGKIRFSQNINLGGVSNVGAYINISNNYIKINSSAVPVLNVSATLELYNLPFSDARPVKDGSTCPSSICTKVSYVNNLLTFTVNQFSTYSAEETPPSSGGCGSCGGSGGGGSSSAKETKTVSANAGEEKTVSFSKDFGITEIAITPAKKLSSESVTIEEVKTTDSSVTSAGPTGSNVYKYLKITSKAALEKAKIKFKVSLGWFVQQEHDENKVTLMHYTDKWESLPTEKISRDSKYAYYEAETTGFSLFAITAEKKVEEAEKTAIEEVVKNVSGKITGNVTAIENVSTKLVKENISEEAKFILPKSILQVKWYLLLLIFVIIAELAYLVYYEMRKKKK